MSFLLQDLNDLRKQAEKMRPEACCGKAIMRETGGNKVTLVCANDCQWQELDRLIAVVMVDAELQKG